MNPDTVQEERKKGESIRYGDAAQPDVLMRAGILQARVLVVVVNDPFATQQAVQNARSMNSGLYIIARTRFMGEVATLLDLGADEVIPEEFETSIEIFTRILNRYLIPEDEIERLIREIRAGGYQMLRSVSTSPAAFENLRELVPDIDMRSIRIPETSFWVGMTLAKGELRSRFHVSVVAIWRGNRMIVNPGGEETIRGSDILMIIGRPDDIRSAFSPAFPSQTDGTIKKGG
jgi:CPA2 family monovalent cation:H+ antiporter-2